MNLAANLVAVLVFLSLIFFLRSIPFSPGWSALNLLTVLLAPVALTAGRLFLWRHPQPLVYAAVLLPILSLALWFRGTFMVVDFILASFGAWAWLGVTLALVERRA